SAPFGSAVKTRKDDRALSARGDELASAAQAFETFDRGLVRLRSSLGKHLCCKLLTRERRRVHGNRLGGIGHFSVKVRGRKLAIFDRKQRIAIRPVKEEYVSRLRRLSHRFQFMTVSHNGYQAGRSWQITIPNIVPHGLEMP